MSNVRPPARLQFELIFSIVSTYDLHSTCVEAMVMVDLPMTDHDVIRLLVDCDLYRATVAMTLIRRHVILLGNEVYV